jgi:putative phosphoesterase
VQHFDNIGHALAQSETYDVVCFGHSHEDELTRHGDTLVVNPGEIFGGLTGQSTFVIYDCESAEAELVEL